MPPVVASPATASPTQSSEEAESRCWRSIRAPLKILDFMPFTTTISKHAAAEAGGNGLFPLSTADRRPRGILILQAKPAVCRIGSRPRDAARNHGVKSVRTTDRCRMPAMPATNMSPGTIDTIAVVVIVASIALVFGQVINHELINWDDQLYITRNTRIQSGLTWDNLAWALTTFDAYNWHPVTWLSFMLDVEMFGIAPGKHQLVNVVVHALAAVLLYVFLRRATGNALPSALVAVLFAIHPLRAESVAWVAERKDVLSALFFMATLLFYAWYVKAPGLLRYGLVTGSLALGLMSKPMLVTLPCVLILADIWPLGRLPLPRESFSNWVRRVRPVARVLLLEKLPWFALALAASVLTVMAQSDGNAVRTLDEIGIADRVANALISYATYLGQIFFPVRLSFFYVFRFDWQVEQLLLSVLALAAITWAVVKKGKSKPYLVVGWLWYLITLLPVIGLVSIGGHAMADRYTYIPSVGFLIMLCWALRDVVRALPPAPRSACLGAAVVVVAVIGFSCFRQVSTWKNGVTLYSHAIAVNPDNFFARAALANELSRRGNYKEAAQEAIEALRVGGEYQIVQGMSYLTLGDIAHRMGNRKQAIEFWNSALVADYVRGETYHRLARMALELKDAQSAAKAIVNSLAADDSGQFWNLSVLWGRDLLKQGHVEEAVFVLGQLRVIAPGDVQVRMHLAEALARDGRLPDAISELEDFLVLKPGDALATAKLAALRASRS